MSSSRLGSKSVLNSFKSYWFRIFVHSTILLLRRKGAYCWINKISIFEIFEFMFCGISNFADFRPPWYGLWYCGSVYSSILVFKFQLCIYCAFETQYKVYGFYDFYPHYSSKYSCQNWSVFFKRYCKVHMFWEGHKIFAKSPAYFWLCVL